MKSLVRLRAYLYQCFFAHFIYIRMGVKKFELIFRYIYSTDAKGHGIYSKTLADNLISLKLLFHRTFELYNYTLFSWLGLWQKISSWLFDTISFRSYAVTIVYAETCIVFSPSVDTK